MIALLDTHSLLWALIEPEKLSPRVRSAVADTANEIYVSTLTFWEISLKCALGKLKLVGCTPEQLVDGARSMSLAIAAPSAEESASFHRLKRGAHKDPFDRMLVWQCLRRDWTLMTRDRSLEDYRALGLKTFW
jgi:PIN domain nuclease of toxin-antitoxin system